MGDRILVPADATSHPNGMTAPATQGRPAGPDRLGALLILLTSLQFGAVVVLGKVMSDSGLPVPSLLTFRFTIAAGLIAILLAFLRLPLTAAPGEGVRLALLGMAGYALEAGLFFAALDHGSAPAVTLLFFTYPVLVSLWALIAGKGLPGWLLGGALACAVAGAALVVLAGGGVEIDRAGVLFSLGSATAFSLYLVGADAVLQRTNSLSGAMWVSAAAAVALGLFSLVSGTAELPEGWEEWGPVLAMAAFTAGAFVCLFAGLRRLGAVRTSILATTEPLAASALAALFLNEAIRAGTVGGGALILAAAVAAALARRERAPIAAEPPVP